MIDHVLRSQGIGASEVAALVGAGYYFWRRGQGQAVLGTIVLGMAVYLPLHLGLGW